MGARLRSWWQKTNKPLVIAGVIALMGVIGLTFAGYWFKWDWTGFNEHIGPNVQQYQSAKTFWDWLQLLGILAIPVVVALGTVWFTTKQGQVSDAENKDNQREVALQAYIDKMSELLLVHGLRQSAEDEEVRKIGRTRTLTILRRLDGERKGSVLQFLQESGLIDTGKHILDLSGADLSGARLSGAKLSRSRLSETDLSGAVLFGVDLSGSDLRRARLFGANLNRADLRGADLRGASISGVYVLQVRRGEADLGKIYQDDLGLEGLSLGRTRQSGIDMSMTHLSGATLKAADLSGADLSGADLVGVDLSEAHLEGANLSGTTLDGVNLSGAHLDGANLSGITYLIGLHKVNLSGAYLDGADLSGADLYGAIGITIEQLNNAKSLQGTIMPDGSKHP